MITIGENLYGNCLHEEALVKEKRLFDAVISLEVCLFLVPSVPILLQTSMEEPYVLNGSEKVTLVVLYLLHRAFNLCYLFSDWE
jgi:hypothetical protein